MGWNRRFINRDDIVTTGFDEDVLTVFTDGSSLSNLGEVVSFGSLADGILVVADGVTIINLGVIETFGRGAAGIAVRGDGATIVNGGTIITHGSYYQPAGGGFLFAEAMLARGDGFSITNFGTIRTEGVFSSAIVGVGADGVAVNFGTIVSFSLDSAVMVVAGARSVATNYGTITVSGDGSSGLSSFGVGAQLINRGEIAVYSDDSFAIQAAAGPSRVVNFGRIETHGDDGAGVFVGDALLENNRSGIIISENETSPAVALQAGGFMEPRLENAGLIAGPALAVRGGSGSQTIVNTGSIVGEVDLGDGADTFVFGPGGSVRGKVILGGGHDRAIIENGAGLSSIADFEPGHTSPDFVDVSAFYASSDDLMAHAAQVGSDVVIALDRDDTLVLENVNRDDLEQNNFVFAGDSSGLPAATLAALADYLVQNHISDEARGPLRWVNPVSVNIDALNASDQALARDSFDLWDDIAGISFVFTSGPADLTFEAPDTFEVFVIVESDGGVITSATVTMGTVTSPFDVLTRSETFLHEIGHALGLGHLGPYNGTWSDQLWSNDTMQWSVMSYGRQDALGHAASNIPFETPAMADILAMGTLYGFRDNHASDTTYGFGNNTGQSAFDFSLTDPASFTIYDTGGTDLIDASLYATDQRISLEGGTWSSIGNWVDNIGIYVTSLIENASGGLGNDVISGNAAANTLKGGGGDDTISGGAGDDTLVGDDGNDIFVFAAGFGADRVLDFDADPVSGQDFIDIRSLGLAAFPRDVTITDLWDDALVQIGADSIVLIGVDASQITQNDFLWH